LQKDSATHTGLLQLNAGDAQLDRLYLDNYGSLHHYAYTLLFDSDAADEMVHEVFLKILEKPKGVTIHTSVKAYLYRSVYNESMNYLKRHKVKKKYEAHTANVPDARPDDPYDASQYRELEQRLKAAINRLPEQCRIVFQLSRFDELKYAEIAERLGISAKTVENQIGRALKKLRVELADYLPLIIAFLMMILLWT
jgi:RNA polymerase sigma-70 factor (ECF subfamily)